LRELESLLGADREVSVARELTKLHEEFLVGPVSRVREVLETRESVKGEIVLCIGPAAATGEDPNAEKLDEAIRLMLREGLRARTIKELMSGLFEMPRSAVYERIEALKKEEGG
jgi:16S rRNA (cytidine1402-2'-O)-methyltransferase